MVKGFSLAAEAGQSLPIMVILEVKRSEKKNEFLFETTVKAGNLGVVGLVGCENKLRLLQVNMVRCNYFVFL